MFRVIFHPDADKEFTEAMIWYEKQKIGLGKRFESSVEAIIEKIKNAPEIFGYSKKPFREASVVLFPYTIVFSINKRKKSVYVAAIYHTSRNPRNKYRKG